MLSKRREAMPRKPRIEMPGYSTSSTEGVEQRVVFKEPSDYEYFKEMMCFYQFSEMKKRFL
jgi:hypothetical protein